MSYSEENLFSSVLKFFGFPFLLVFGGLIYINSQTVSQFALKSEIKFTEKQEMRVFFAQAIDGLERRSVDILDARASAGTIIKIDEKSILVKLKKSEVRSVLELETEKGVLEIPLSFETKPNKRIWTVEEAPDALYADDWEMGKPEKPLEQKVIFQRKTKWASSGKLLARIRAGDGRDFLPVSYYLEDSYELSFDGGRAFDKREPGLYMDEVRSGHIKWLFHLDNQTAVVDAPDGKRRLFLYPGIVEAGKGIKFKVKTLMREQMVFGVLWSGDKAKEVFFEKTGKDYYTEFFIPERYLNSPDMKFSAHLTVRPASNEWDVRFIGRDDYDTALVFPRAWGDNYTTSEIDEPFLKERLGEKKEFWRYWLRKIAYFNIFLTFLFMFVKLLKNYREVRAGELIIGAEVRLTRKDFIWRCIFCFLILAITFYAILSLF